MSIYFLFEGKRTEPRIYPNWLSEILPTFSRVKSFDEVIDHNYYVFSGEGWPSLLHNHFVNSIKDVNSIKSYKYLIIILDSEENSVDEKRNEVIEFYNKCGTSLDCAKLEIIVQYRCIETWLLGNKRIIKRNPTDSKLADHIRNHSIIDVDPEDIGCDSAFETHAQFHYELLRLVFQERALTYSKTNPGHARDIEYYKAIKDNVEKNKSHLKSFQLMQKTFHELE